MKKFLAVLITAVMLLAVIAVPTTAAESASLKDGLLLHYDFSNYDPTTGDLPNSVVGGCKAVIGYGASQAIKPADGINGTALFFDGEACLAAYSEDGLGDTLKNLEKLTISMWVYPTELPTVRGTKNRYFFCDDVWGAGSFHWQAVWDAEDQPLKQGALQLGLKGNKGLAVAEGSEYFNGYTGYYRSKAVPVEKWTRITVTYDYEARTLSCYMNGVKETVVYDTAVPYNAASIFIGGHPDGPLKQAFFKGYMEDFRFYNRVLTDAEVNELEQGDLQLIPEIKTASPDTTVVETTVSDPGVTTPTVTTPTVTTPTVTTPTGSDTTATPTGSTTPWGTPSTTVAPTVTTPSTGDDDKKCGSFSAYTTLLALISGAGAFLIVKKK